MRHDTIGLQRLRAQSLVGSANASPLETVQKLGAVQAQDYAQSVWAVGARTTVSSANSVTVHSLTR
jgi:hypothetical protein